MWFMGRLLPPAFPLGPTLWMRASLTDGLFTDLPLTYTTLAALDLLP